MQLTRTLLSLGLMLAPMVSANPIPEASSATTAGDLFARASYDCPATNNGQFGNYAAHSYTSGQITAAKATAQKILQAKGSSWKPGSQDYPHFFNNNEKFPFDCGKNKAEYPLQPSGQTWQPGESVQTLPDRVIFEYSWSKNKVSTKECGVIRHGPPPGNAFLNCA
ncbi:hypothetical protein F4804DRAFT_339036 [Jackrogersella minutella]|nr:hypothetical protein F4804DRAFT_339036 [Jackrogersella minutella]